MNRCLCVASYSLLALAAAPVAAQDNTDPYWSRCRDVFVSEARLAREFADFHRDLLILQRQLQAGSTEDKTRADVYGKILDECHRRALHREFAKLIASMSFRHPDAPGAIEGFLEQAEVVEEGLAKLVAITSGRDEPEARSCRDQRSVFGEKYHDLDEKKILGQIHAIKKEHHANLILLSQHFVEQKLIVVMRHMEIRMRPRRDFLDRTFLQEIEKELMKKD